MEKKRKGLKKIPLLTVRRKKGSYHSPFQKKEEKTKLKGDQIIPPFSCD